MVHYQAQKKDETKMNATDVHLHNCDVTKSRMYRFSVSKYYNFYKAAKH